MLMVEMLVLLDELLLEEEHSHLRFFFFGWGSCLRLEEKALVSSFSYSSSP
jgi:hypothetical protein